MHFADEISYKISHETEFVIRTSLAASMTADPVLLLVLSSGLSLVIGDHHHGYEAAYVYPDPVHYVNTSGLTSHGSSGRTRYGGNANIKY